MSSSLALRGIPKWSRTSGAKHDLKTLPVILTPLQQTCLAIESKRFHIGYHRAEQPQDGLVPIPIYIPSVPAACLPDSNCTETLVVCHLKVDAECRGVGTELLAAGEIQANWGECCCSNRLPHELLQRGYSQQQIAVQTTTKALRQAHCALWLFQRASSHRQRFYRVGDEQHTYQLQSSDA